MVFNIAYQSLKITDGTFKKSLHVETLDFDTNPILI